MEDPNQTFVSGSFMALYTKGGRPTAPREDIEARYDFCDDLATQVAEMCRTVQFSNNLSETASLKTCFDGLMQPPAAASPAETAWVMCRVAELLEWPVPPWLTEQVAAHGEATRQR